MIYMASNYYKYVIKTLEKFFAKAPHMPKNVREILVKITPWFAIIFGILGVLGGLYELGALITNNYFPFQFGERDATYYVTGFLAFLWWIGPSVLLIAAYPGLKAGKAKGWNLLFWSETTNVIISVVGLQLVSALIGGLIGFYLLFEIKSYYK